MNASSALSIDVDECGLIAYGEYGLEFTGSISSNNPPPK